MKKEKRYGMRVNNILLIILSVLLVFSGMPLEQIVRAEEKTENETFYEIYPTPQNIDYREGEFVIRPVSNVVFDSTIDRPTKNRLYEIFEDKNVELITTDKMVDDQSTNILVGTVDSEEFVDEYFKDNISYDDDFFDQVDPYILDIDDGTIAILGKDTDAAFYGVTTLMHILDQIEGKTIRNLRIDDYSSTTIRGFIEGYYGIPWTDQDRMSLMEFGGNFKMTSYVFAPKDDPYHNSEWRKPYPEERLNEIEEMVEVGRENKVNFAWTIHPFMHDGINHDNYDESIEAMINKFEQLYDIGIRQFGVLADDAGGIDPNLFIKVMNDLDQWAEEKGDVYDFLTVPAGYNTSWANWDELNQLDDGFSDRIHIMWTGDTVTGHVTQETIDNFKTNHLPEDKSERRDPVFWLNWPVNDINMNRLLMGKGEMLQPDVEGLDGVVSNPMQDAEASKVALFATADYAWNVDDFDDSRSWNDSFKYIDQDAPQHLHTLAKHMSDPAPNGHGLELGESEELKPLLEEFIHKLDNDESIIETGNHLIKEFQEIAEASEKFLKLTKNERLKEQVEPFANSIKDLANANISFIKIAIAIENEDTSSLWENYAKASSLFDSSKSYERPTIDGTTEALPGSKRLIPFAEKLKDDLSPKVEEIVNVDKFKQKPITSYNDDQIYEGDLKHLIDEDKDSFVWFNQYIDYGDYVGVEFNKPVDVKGLKVLQGKDPDDEDAFYYGKFQYYDLDTEEWADTTGKSYGEYKNTVEEFDLDIQTTKVRFIVDEDEPIKHEDEPNPKWAAFREFKVITEDDADTTDAYTNAKNLSLEAKLDTDRFELLPDEDVLLKDGEYVGLKLKRIHDLQNIALSTSNTDLQLQVAKNEYEWIDVEDTEDLPSGRYIRLLNDTGKDITFDIEKFVVTSKEIEPFQLKDYYFQDNPDVTDFSPENATDGDLTTSSVFQTHQRKGDYLIYDIGQEIDLDSLEIYVHDSSLDFIYDGIVSISTDKEDWNEIIEIGDQEPNEDRNADINDSFPNYKVSYNTVLKEDINQRARYIKIEITQDVDRWIEINEIEINGGEYLKVDNDVRFESDVIEEKGGQATNLIDGDLGSMYVPSEPNGTLTYYLSEGHDRNSLTILQSENSISKAEVKARIAPENDPTNSETITLGRLMQSFNKFNLPEGYLVFDIQIEWDDVIPNLYELILDEEDIKDVDKSKLKEAIARTIDKDQLTENSITTYEEALQVAEEIYDNEYASQLIVDQVTNELNDAIDNAQERGDGEELQQIIDEALNNDENLYTTSSWSNLITITDKATKALEDPDNLSEEDVETYKNDIEEAINDLKYEVFSKENAIIMLEDAEAMLASIENPEKVYTKLSYETFNEAIHSLSELLEEDEESPVVPTALQESTEQLNQAKENLVDATKLYILLDEFNEEDEIKYTDATFEVYQEAIKKGEQVVIDGSEEDVQKAIKNIEQALAKLELVIESLEEAIKHYSDLDSTDYTEDSFRNLQSKLGFTEQ